MFESLLHRQISKTQTPDVPRESRGFVVFGVRKIAPWDHHGTWRPMLVQKEHVVLANVASTVFLDMQNITEAIACRYY